MERIYLDHAATTPLNSKVLGKMLPYFTEEYGLDYCAAFPGCSADTEPSAATVAFLIDKVKGENIPVVFSIELSNGRLAEAVAVGKGKYHPGGVLYIQRRRVGAA